MIDHIKLAEECGFCHPLGEPLPNMVCNKAELQAYTNAILEYAAVKCDEHSVSDSEYDLGAFDCAEAIRQEKV